MVRVGLMQVAVNDAESVSARIERVVSEARVVADQAELVILPELWPTGAFDLQLGVKHAQPRDGPLMTQLAGVAAQGRCWVHTGSFVEADSAGRFYNTSVVFDPNGSIAASYRKIHLFGFGEGEAEVLTGGDELAVLDTPLGRTGLATCYDLRFPELFRALADEGVTSVLVTSGWPVARINRWRILAQARAMENQFWLVGCNESGTHADIELGGASLVVDPWGEVVAELGQGAGVLFADLDPGFPDSVRSSFPVLADRKL